MLYPFRQTSQRVWLCVSLLALTCVGACPRIHADELSAEFKRAIQQFLKDDPQKQKRGENAIRRLGDQAVRELRVWIVRAQKSLERVSMLLENLEGLPQSDASDQEIRRFFLRKLESGWEALRNGDYQTARGIAEGLIALDPDSALLFNYRRLLLATDRRMLTKEVLEPSVEFRERVVEFGESPRVVFRLKNNSKDSMVITAQKGVLGTLEIETVRSLFQGNVLREVESAPIYTFDRLERVSLAAGESYEMDVPIELDVPETETGMVVRLQVVGRFRPSQWGVGERNVSISLELPEAECWAVPKGERDLALSPLKKLEVSVFFRRIQKFFAAGQLAVWAGEDDPVLNDRLIRLLVSSLEKLERFRIPGRESSTASSDHRSQPERRRQP